MRKTKTLCNKTRCKKMRRKYSELKYNSLQFIWGVKSWDDLTSADANLYTMNDIEIYYDKDAEKYVLSIETIYSFENGKRGEIAYLNSLLSAFKDFMIQNDYDIDDPCGLFLFGTMSSWRADSISELYTMFRVFVEGYNSVYCEDKTDDADKHSKWEISFDGYYPYCLKCGYRPDRDKLTDFCPDCGRRMDGGNNA